MENDESSSESEIYDKVLILIQYVTVIGEEEILGPVQVINSDDVYHEDYKDEMNMGMIIRVFTETGLRVARVLISETDSAFVQSENNLFKRRRAREKAEYKIAFDNAVRVSSSVGPFKGSDSEPDTVSDSSDVEYTPKYKKVEVRKRSKRSYLKPKKQRQSLRLDRPATEESKEKSEESSVEKTSKTFNQHTQTDDNYKKPLIEVLNMQNELRSDLDILSQSIQRLKDCVEDRETINEDYQYAYRQAMIARSMRSNDKLSSNSKSNSSLSKMADTPVETSSTVTNSKIPTMADDDEHIDFIEMVPIGRGRTLVPKDLYNEVRWDNYLAATRKLLMAVFPREVLATHKLTERPYRTFLSETSKMKLDPIKIDDIITTVTLKTGVPVNSVKLAITSKCYYEHSQYKKRKEYL